MAHNPYTPPSAELADLARGSLPPRPRQVKASLGLVFLSIAISVAGYILDGATPGYERGEPRAFYILLAAYYLVVLGLGALLIFYLARGYRWARIVFSALVGLFVVQEVRELPETLNFEWSFVVLYLLNILVRSACVLLLFSPAANRWFRGLPSSAAGCAADDDRASRRGRASDPR